MPQTRVGLLLQVHDKASRQMRGFNNVLGSSTRHLRAFAGGIVAVAGIGGIGYMLKKTMESIDATAKLSDRIGMATENIIGLQYGAKIMGVEQETLNKSLEQFSKRLGEVRMGVGEARYALDEFGLSADELASKTPEQALAIIADKMSQLENQVDKTAAATKLFGRSGISLVNLLQQGSVGIEKFQKEAEKLRLTYSRFDAAQVEAANDALARMRFVFQGLFQRIVIQLSPYITTLAESFVDAATKGGGMGSKVTSAMEAIAQSAVQVELSLTRVRLEFSSFRLGALEAEREMLTFLDKWNKALSFEFPFDKLTNWIKEKYPEYEMSKLLPMAQKYNDLLSGKAFVKGFLPEELQPQQLIRDLDEAIIQATEKQDMLLQAYLDTFQRILEIQIKFNNIRAESLEKPAFETGISAEDLAFTEAELPMDLLKKWDAERAKQIKSIQMTTSAIEKEARATELVVQGQAKSADAAKFMLDVWSTYGEKTQEATAAIERHQAAIDRLALANNELQKIENKQKAVQTLEEVNAKLDAEYNLIGRIGQAWEHAEARAQAAAAAVESYGLGTAKAAAEIEKIDKKIERNRIAENWQQMTQTMTSSFSEVIRTAMFDFERLGEVVESVIQSIIIKIIELQFINPVSESISAGITQMFNTSGFSSKATLAPAVGPIRTFYGHGGGIAGESAASIERLVPSLAFVGAPRYHAGLLPGEVPAILQEGEGVFTPDQMARLAPVGSAERTVMPNITVVNESGVPLKIDTGNSFFDVKDMIIALVQQNINQGGELYDALKRK